MSAKLEVREVTVSTCYFLTQVFSVCLLGIMCGWIFARHCHRGIKLYTLEFQGLVLECNISLSCAPRVCTLVMLQFYYILRTRTCCHYACTVENSNLHLSLSVIIHHMMIAKVNMYMHLNFG